MIKIRQEENEDDNEDEEDNEHIYKSRCRAQGNVRNIIILILATAEIYLGAKIYELSQINHQLAQQIESSQTIKSTTSTQPVAMPLIPIQNLPPISQIPLQTPLQPVSVPKLPFDLQKMVKMGKPRQKPIAMKLVIIQSKHKKQGNVCTIINAVSIVRNLTITTLFQFMQANARKIIMIVDAEDYLLHRYINALQRDYEVIEIKVLIDSEYRFIRSQTRMCTNLIYLQNHFYVTNEGVSALIRKAQEIQSFHMIYTASVFIADSTTQTLQNLNLTDLQNAISAEDISKYIFIFDSAFLRIVTPLNFAYFNKYTVQEIIIYPVIAMLQGSPNLQQMAETVHKVKRSYVQFKQFELVQTKREANNLCFLSFPNDPSTASSIQLSQYLSALQNKDNVKEVSLVVFAPYSFKHSQATESLWGIGKLLLDYQEISIVRFRIRANKTVASLGGYESAHTYCPSKSTMVSSRQNIRFYAPFISTVLKSINQQHHIYFFKFRNPQKQQVGMENRFSFSRKSKGSQIFSTYFQSLQVIKTDFFRMLYLWLLKCEEIDFYETEASFIFPLLEISHAKVSTGDSIVYEINSRQITQREVRQLNNLKTYYEWPGMREFKPFAYNSLSNPSLRRFAHERIPRKIHQIWLGENQISDFRSTLAKTFLQKNPDYEYYFWRQENITYENFPYSYPTVMRTLQFEKESKRSYVSGVTDLLRSEIIFRYGGIYSDFKAECKKSLDPFLKYEVFFMDPDYQPYHEHGMKFVTPGFEGGVRFNHYFNILLTNILVPQKLDYSEVFLPKMIGGFTVRQALNDQQLFVIAGYGMQLFSQNVVGSKLCEIQKHFKANQQVFNVYSNKKNKMLKIGLPCELYEESYVIFYMQIGGSWFGEKKVIKS